jgi:hypothetical protein
MQTLPYSRTELVSIDVEKFFRILHRAEAIQERRNAEIEKQKMKARAKK